MEEERTDAETLRQLEPLPSIVDAMDLETDPQSPVVRAANTHVARLLNAPRASPRAVSRADSRDQAEREQRVGVQRQLFRDRSTRLLHALDATPPVRYTSGSQIMLTRLELLNVNNPNRNAATNITEVNLTMRAESSDEPIN